MLDSLIGVFSGHWVVRWSGQLPLWLSRCKITFLFVWLVPLPWEWMSMHHRKYRTWLTYVTGVIHH